MDVLYPVYLKLQNRPVLVIGAGTVATRRIRRLLESGAVVTVVAPQASDDVRAWAAQRRLQWHARTFRYGDLHGAFLVLFATGDRDLAAELRRRASAHGFLFNAAEDESLSDFHVPASCRSQGIQVAVSTGGASPGTAAALGAELAEWLEGRQEDAGAADRRQAQRQAQREEQRAARGSVHLVGGGPGDPGLLTVRARHLLDTADVVFHDRLVSASLIETIPATARIVYVGKEVGCAHRANIAALMIEAAREGKRVVRLKGGDPMVFGRGGEEVLALFRAGIRYEIVPGVSALSAVPAAAGIPVTVRGVASEVIVRSGHRFEVEVTAGGQPIVSTRDAGKEATERETTFVYFMAVSRLEFVVDELRREGVADSTPSAIIEKGTQPRQRVITGELGTMAAQARDYGIAAPSLVIVGEAVLFHDLASFAARLEERIGGQIKEKLSWRDSCGIRR